MNPLPTSNSTVAAAPSTVTARHIAMLSPAEWTDALAGVAAPQGRHPVAPPAREPMDGDVRDFSVADAVARATTQLAVATPAAAKAGAVASTGTPAQTVSDETSVAQSVLFQHQALASTATDTAASSSLGATGRSPAAAIRRRGPSQSETTDAAPRAEVLPQSPVLTEKTSSRGVDTGETGSGDVSRDSAKAATISQPATGGRAIRAGIRQPAADRAGVSSPAAAPVTAAVSTTQPLQPSLNTLTGLPGAPASAVVSAPGSVATTAQSAAAGSLTGSPSALAEAGLTGGATAPTSAARQTRTSGAATGVDAAEVRGEAARVAAGDPAATMAMTQPPGTPASTSRLLPVDPSGSVARGSRTAEATTREPLASVAALRSALPATAEVTAATPSGPNTATSATIVDIGQPAASAPVTGTTSMPGSSSRLPATLAPQPEPVAFVNPSSPAAATVPSATVILTHAAQAQPARATSQAASDATTVAPSSPLPTSHVVLQDGAHGIGSQATSATTTTTGTAAPNAALPLAFVADPASAVSVDAGAAGRAGDAAPHTGSPARSASAAAATTTAAPTGKSVALTPMPTTKPATMTAIQGAVSLVGTPASASSLVTGSLSAGLSPTAANAAGGTVSGTGGVGSTPAPTAAPTPLGYTAATPDAMAASIVAMYRSGQSSLVLRLDPPGLGTVSVHLALGGNADVNVLFVPAVAQTAHLLQTGLGDLRQAMAASGLTLGQATIGGGGGSGGTNGSPKDQSGASTRSAATVATLPEPARAESATRGARAIA